MPSAATAGSTTTLQRWSTTCWSTGLRLTDPAAGRVDDLVSRVANAENNRTEPRRLGPLSGGLGRNWNEHRMRFISHKTTDQILDNLTGYLNRISNSGH